MKSCFVVDENHFGLYIREAYATKGVFPGSSDEYLACLCGLNEKQYQNIMLIQYNAIPISKVPSIYFKEFHEAEKAIEWIDSMVLMEKLII